MSDECEAQLIDGHWDTSGCGCVDCDEDRHDEVERQVENGHLTDEEARERHARLDDGRIS